LGAATPAMESGDRRTGGALNRRPVVLIGGGEHARVVAEAIHLCRVDVLGYLAKEEPPAAAWPEVKYLGDDRRAAELASSGVGFVLALGSLANLATRRSLADHYDSLETDWVTVVHPSAIVSPHAQLKLGAFVAAGSVINTGASIGRHAIVNSGAIIEHDVAIGDHVIVGPGVTIGGGSVVEEGAVVGMAAVIRDHLTVGAHSVVGMGAVVTRSVPPGVTVVGMPAKERSGGE